LTDDLRAIDVPTLVMHGDDDQVVPIADSAELAIELLRNGTLTVYPATRTGCARPTPTSSTRICSRSSQADPPAAGVGRAGRVSYRPRPRP
jgi:hypothetical protein